jgi:hypothetical protein
VKGLAPMYYFQKRPNRNFGHCLSAIHARTTYLGVFEVAEFEYQVSFLITLTQYAEMVPRSDFDEKSIIRSIDIDRLLLIFLIFFSLCIISITSSFQRTIGQCNPFCGCGVTLCERFSAYVLFSEMAKSELWTPLPGHQ